MKEKIVVSIDKKDIRAIILIIIIPLLLTFIIEHFGEFNYTYINGGSMMNVEMNSLTFITPFGNSTTYDISGQGIGYDMIYDNGLRYEINSTYSGKFPYYLKGLFNDIIYPIIVTVTLIIIYFFRKRFSLKIN